MTAAPNTMGAPDGISPVQIAPVFSPQSVPVAPSVISPCLAAIASLDRLIYV